MIKELLLLLLHLLLLITHFSNMHELDVFLTFPPKEN